MESGRKVSLLKIVPTIDAVKIQLPSATLYAIGDGLEREHLYAAAQATERSPLTWLFVTAVQTEDTVSIYKIMQPVWAQRSGADTRSGCLLLNKYRRLFSPSVLPSKELLCQC